MLVSLIPRRYKSLEVRRVMRGPFSAVLIYQHQVSELIGYQYHNELFHTRVKYEKLTITQWNPKNEEQKVAFIPGFDIAGVARQ